MEQNMKVIDTFEIPEDLAQELSDLLTKKSVRENVLVQIADQPDKYEEMEKLILPVVRRIDAIKSAITMKYVPKHYQFPQYVWNYNGWDIDRNNVQILTTLEV